MMRSHCSCETCGPCVVSGSNGSPTFCAFAFLTQLLDELIVDLFLDEQPAAGAAALALVEEQAEVGALDGGVEVGVGEDDVGALAAQLQADALEVALGGRLHDDLAGRVFAGEGDLVDVHVAAEGGAGGRAVAGHDVDDAVGKPASWASCGDAQGGQRRLLGRLEDDGAAGRQGRAPLPRLHQQREVPRDDLADDADRLVPRVAEVSCPSTGIVLP